MNKEVIIETVKKNFDEIFANQKYYEKQTRDDDHLKKILDSLLINEDSKVLDLGTGRGYLAFSLAESNKNSQIVGLDIVVNTLEKNKTKANELKLSNLSFVSYSGITFPFEDNTFDCIVTRYALHHFPDIEKAFSEIQRVLKPGGQLFISDPTPNGDDKMRFVDTFMQLSKDGHVKFYTKNEFEREGQKVGLELDKYFITQIRFPSSRRTEGYLKIEPSIDRNIIDSYNIEIINNEVYITEKVLNISFKNTKK